jgi:hypothetical protein
MTAMLLGRYATLARLRLLVLLLKLGHSTTIARIIASIVRAVKLFIAPRLGHVGFIFKQDIDLRRIKKVIR